VADRYCGNCGQELGEEARFCPSCGRAVHEVARVPTPEADVAVPPLPNPQEAESDVGSGGQGGRVSSADSTSNALIGLGVVVAVVVGAVAGGGRGGVVVLMLLILPALALFLRTGGRGLTSRDEVGRLVLRAGSGQRVPESARSRLLAEGVSEYMRGGFFVRHRTATTAQLVKPKKFSSLWALLWFLVFGIGIVVYLIYYAAKRGEGRYVEVDEYGAVRATRQVHHVL
jgi:hypothetical protein